MKNILVCLLFWISCDGVQFGLDAGPDSAVPVDAMTSGLVWTCKAGCFADSPLAYKDIMIVSGDTVLFKRSTCLPCDPIIGTIGPLIGDCHSLTVMEWEGMDSRRGTYCPGAVLTGEIEYHGYPGPIGPKVWIYESRD